MAEPPLGTGRVFMSYRREETAYAAGWLFDRLVEHLGAGQVFKDVDSIELGDDFVDAIDTAVGSCDVLLALIGDQWLTITDEHGNRRLDDPSDFVHLEIEAALTRGVRVIPILVEGARMPRADELPASLAKLVRRQALELSPSRFDFDTSRLLRVLDKTLAELHTEQAVADSTSAPPVEAPGPIGTGARREPAPKVEAATPAGPPPSGSEDSGGLDAAKQRVRSIWASRGARLTIAAALIALVAIPIIIDALSDGGFSGTDEDIATLNSATPQSAQPCTPDPNPYLVRDSEALAQQACKDALPASATLVYALYSDGDSAKDAAKSAIHFERNQEHAKPCSTAVADQVTNDSPDAGYCQLSENEDTIEITWTNDNVLGVVNFLRSDTHDDEAVNAWKPLR